jgi:pyruvate formate-lyase activating enzyme-like uncharacterized protein
MFETLSEFRKHFADMASNPKPFKVVRIDEMKQKPAKEKEYEQIIYYKEYIWDLPIVGVEVPQNRGMFMNILEVHGSNNGIFMNPAMRLEHQDDKYRTMHDHEQSYLARDSYPEKFYDDYWQEGVDDLNN